MELLINTLAGFGAFIILALAIWGLVCLLCWR
jgi:hypothetical protein